MDDARTVAIDDLVVWHLASHFCFDASPAAFKELVSLWRAAGVSHVLLNKEEWANEITLRKRSETTWNVGKLFQALTLFRLVPDDIEFTEDYLRIYFDKLAGSAVWRK